MNILVVEDDRTIASGLTYSLQQEGFTTVLCHSAADATAAIIQFIPMLAQAFGQGAQPHITIHIAITTASIVAAATGASANGRCGPEQPQCSRIAW